MTPSKYLIITADDYGYSEERDDGILECYHDNSISNVSVMVNGCHVEEAIRKADAVGLPMGNNQLHIPAPTQSRATIGPPAKHHSNGYCWQISRHPLLYAYWHMTMVWLHI